MNISVQRREADRHLLENGPMQRDDLIGWLMPRLSFGQWQSGLKHRKSESARLERRGDDWEVGARDYARKLVYNAIARGTWLISSDGMVSHRDWGKSSQLDVRQQLDLLRALLGAPSAGDIITAVLSLWRGQAWRELGYPSWAALTEAELSAAPRLTAEVRQEAIRGLRAGGMSTRAIGAALGVSGEKVRRDLSTDTNVAVAEPVVVTGLDGKDRTYTPQPTPSDLPAARKPHGTSTNVDTAPGKKEPKPARPWHEIFAQSNDLVEQEALLKKYKPALVRHMKQKPRERARTRTRQGIAPVIDIEERRA